MTSNVTASTQHGVILMLAAVMPAMAIISLVPVLPLLMQEFSSVKGYEFLVPIAMTVPALCVAVFSPIAGWLSDKLGRKNLLLSSLVIYAVIGLAPFFLSHLFQIIASRVLLGMAEAVIMTVATALIGDYFVGKERDRWVSIQIACVSISAIVLIAIGGILGQKFGSRGPFLLYLLALPIALLVSFILFEPNRIAKDPEAIDSPTKMPMAKVLPLLGITLFVGIVFYFVIVKLGQILGLVADVSPAQIGAIGAVANLAVAAGSFVFGRLKGSSGPKLLLIGFLLAALGYSSAALSQVLVLTTVGVVVASIGSGMMLPTMLTWVLQVLPENVRGRGTGLWTGVFFFGQFSAPIVVAALQKNMGSLASVLFLFGALCALAAFLSALKTKNAAPLVSK